MILDLHTHSIASDDGRAKVENYCQWIRKKELPLDGFVLTEHRQFDAASDYRHLEDEYGLLILKASEVETDYGHVLVFGVNDDLVNSFDFARVDNPIGEVLEAATRCGAVAAPCHPGRPNVGLFAHYENKGIIDEVALVEVYNGGSRPGEDELSEQKAAEFGYKRFGGSDSHIVSRIGYCATEFDDDITSIDELVGALETGRFQPRSWRT
ncbi:MAG: PHP domain-containing protein [Actinomycetia bacterium]|nr:PHP domain-containing protein [Actinomycetes bacterium]MCP3911524.1 PHP domain-containing protein [Actinomycetes bacterium]MCP4084571.1 PHP domain-containing protein [Actinomycetes bacterium]